MKQSDLIAVVKQWLRYAGEDLELAEAMVSGNMHHPRHVCWLAQQASEKAIKAILIYFQIDFPRTHDLERLCLLLPNGWTLKKNPVELSALSDWAVESRYPGDWPEATETDAREAVRLAREIWESLHNDMRHFGVSL